MTFDFPIRGTLRTSWTTFKNHWIFFVAMSLVTVLLNTFSNKIQDWDSPFSILGLLFVMFISVIWGFIWLKVSLAAADNQEDKLNFTAVQSFLPAGKQFWQLVGVGALAGLAVLGGFIALIIPGIYIMVRLAFSNLVFADKGFGAGASVKYSWHLVTGERFWTVLLVIMTCIALIILGILCVGLGILIAYPLIMMLIAHLYRALDNFHIASMGNTTQAPIAPEQVVEVKAEPVV